jgi:Thioesterase-like superfamily
MRFLRCCGGTATAIRTTALDLPAHPRPVATMPPPDATTPTPLGLPFAHAKVGYHTSVELRLARGVWGQGPCAAWMRVLIPLVDGEEATQLKRVVVCADAGNGVSITLPVTRYTVLNPDLTVYLHRHPAGEWIGLDAVTVLKPTGVGLTTSYLHDETGPIGRSRQSLVVEPRQA